jgi:predicted XRE-type DNA-binding protein
MTGLFRDLGFDAGESNTLELRSDLMIAVSKLLRRRRLTPARAAATWGVSPLQVRDVMRGRIDRLSIEVLVSMLAYAGVDVQLVVEPRSPLR